MDYTIIVEMSREKTTKIENNSFAKNINKLVVDNGGRYVFAEAIGVSYEAVRQWCIGEKIPDGKRLLAIHDKYHVSIDWLLTGKESPPPDPSDQVPAEIRAACQQCRDILLSDHKIIKPALLSNLAAFHSSIQVEAAQKKENEKLNNENVDLNRRLTHVEQLLEAKQCTGTDEAASSSTGR
jgi:transcriptional regulator with XRE-family HTH domain